MILRPLMTRIISRSAPFLVTRSMMSTLSFGLMTVLSVMPFSELLRLLITPSTPGPLSNLTISDPLNAAISSLTIGAQRPGGMSVPNTPASSAWAYDVVSWMGYLEILSSCMWYFLSLGLLWPLSVIASVLGWDWLMPGSLPSTLVNLFKSIGLTLMIPAMEFLVGIKDQLSPEAPKWLAITALASCVSYMYLYWDSPFVKDLFQFSTFLWSLVWASMGPSLPDLGFSTACQGAWNSFWISWYWMSPSFTHLKSVTYWMGSRMMSWFSQ